eukprot:3535543-Rhodomonas_salina.2
MIATTPTVTCSHSQDGREQKDPQLDRAAEENLSPSPHHDSLSCDAECSCTVITANSHHQFAAAEPTPSHSEAPGNHGNSQASRPKPSALPDVVQSHETAAAAAAAAASFPLAKTLCKNLPPLSESRLTSYPAGVRASGFCPPTESSTKLMPASVSRSLSTRFPSHSLLVDSELLKTSESSSVHWHEIGPRGRALCGVPSRSRSSSLCFGFASNARSCDSSHRFEIRVA